MPRISQLPAKTTPASGDEIAIVEVATSTTKKITRADLLKGADLPNDTVTTGAIKNGAVTTDKIADKAVTAGKIDFTTFGDYFKKIHRSLSITTVGTGGAVVSGGGYSFTAPFDGVCVMYGSVPMRSDSGSVVDATVKFRLNGADITPAANTELGRTIFSGGTARLHDTSPWARIPIIKGTTYNLTVYAQTSVNGSSAADGCGYVEYELYEKSYADAVIS